MAAIASGFVELCPSVVTLLKLSSAKWQFGARPRARSPGIDTRGWAGRDHYCVIPAGPGLSGRGRKGGIRVCPQVVAGQALKLYHDQ